MTKGSVGPQRLQESLSAHFTIKLQKLKGMQEKCEPGHKKTINVAVH